MREAIAVMDRRGRTPKHISKADLDFHLALAEAAANPLILSLLDSIVGLLREQRMRIFRWKAARSAGSIITSGLSRRWSSAIAEKAREAMRAHLQQVREDSQGSARRQIARFRKPSRSWELSEWPIWDLSVSA